ncbi:unnamed protein product [Pleuronectes platessa]|uniref:Uncharacterized protein n=1 Tax=Pleuronectes platessa TaxID=8262 RepID=A0A9N7ZAD2_PLEPL|nr:unnamed protein product [Pleuronectes platessa]
MLKDPLSMEMMKRASHEPDHWFRFDGRRSWTGGSLWLQLEGRTLENSDRRGEEFRHPEGGEPLFPRVHLSHELVSEAPCGESPSHQAGERVRTRREFPPSLPERLFSVTLLSGFHLLREQLTESHRHNQLQNVPTRSLRSADRRSNVLQTHNDGSNPTRDVTRVKGSDSLRPRSHLNLRDLITCDRNLALSAGPQRTAEVRPVTAFLQFGVELQMKNRDINQHNCKHVSVKNVKMDDMTAPESEAKTSESPPGGWRQYGS